MDVVTVVGVCDRVVSVVCDGIDVFVEDVVIVLGKEDVVVIVGAKDGVDDVGVEVVVVDVGAEDVVDDIEKLITSSTSFLITCEKLLITNLLKMIRS